MSRNSGQSVRWAVRIGVVVLLGSAAAVAGVTVQGVTVQGVTVQGVTVQGVTVQGVTVQGVTVQGVTVQGVSSQGVTVQGVTVQGVTVQGVTVQGVTVQGVTVQGVASQGVTVQGASLMGTDLLASDFDGVSMTSVDLRGLTAGSSIEPHTLTSLPTMSVGPGNYIALASGSAAKHYAVAHFANAAGNPAQDLDLFIAGEQRDPVPNLLHNYDEQDNQDELYVVYYFHKWSGEWVSLCPYNPATGSASAMAIPEDSGNPNKFYFACTATGVASKCARNWGYRPWAQTKGYVFDASANGGTGGWLLKPFPLRPYYETCKVAAMAGYCQNGQSFTKTGTQVDLFDTQQLVWPNSIENPWNGANPGSLWMNAQEYFIAQDKLDPPFDTALHKSALQRSRYRELSPVTEGCDDFAGVDRLEHDHIEDGRWGALFKEIGTVNVFSPTYCTHDEYTPGDALPWDCSPCTTQVCKTSPECCGSAGAANAWTVACIGKAGMVCNDGAPPNWPAGKVWPKDAPNADVSIYPTFLLGPTGALLRADGVSGSGSSATITGWACDPEWPGASVAVRVYGGGTADGGGTLLGEVRADQALAAPLASEVSAACDGPGRTYARHGFSFTLPVNQTGNVFVYAIDESTANGPPAPATLLRNGAALVPRCEHSEHVTGDPLSASCSTCAGNICEDGSHGACCTDAWTAECVAAADACAPADTSVTFNSRSFAAVTTGWIEAPVTGTYTFQASQQPSRLFINGTTVLDWFTTAAGMTSGTIELRAGHRYNLRWDRLQAAPPMAPGQGLTWQPPGTIGQTAIPSANLYGIAPGGTTGLSATYFTNFEPAGFTGLVSPRIDGNIDINKDIAPPGPTPLDLPATYGPSYSATWEGEIIPTFTESHNFYVVGSGKAHLYLNGTEVSFPGPAASSPPPQGACAHDLCQVGPKLDSSCNSCAHDICAADPYCCNGGYLSYYSFEPEWDARCMAEVATYCPGSRCNPPDPQPPLSPQKKSAAVPLEAGVHYRVQLTYDNATSDKTIRLLWASPRLGKQAVPQFALQPLGVPNNAGSGLNVTYFATKSQNGVVKADGTAVATGFVPDLALTPSIGQLGTPLVDVLAASPNALSGKPSPPSVVRPRYGEEIFVTGAMIAHIKGIGGITGGWVYIEGGGGSAVTVAVAANGNFLADLPVTIGAHTLKFTQLTHDPSVLCAPPNPCTQSKTIEWPIVVTLETASPRAPEILTPKDPTHTAVAAPLVLNVVGKGTSGPVHVQDLGSVPAIIPDIPANPDGSFSGQITLGFGAPGDPNPGWHKLVFNQGGAPSRAVFVSVGIDPPTVEFPRNGAELDCEQPDGSPPPARGTIPYPVDKFPLRVMEETGRQGLGDFGAKTRIIQPPQGSGDPVRFESDYSGAGPGRHVLLFFQAPNPPANATPAERDEHLRAWSSMANTPTSRIVVNIPPPRFQIPAGLAAVVGGRGFTGTTTNLPPPGQGPFVLGASDCRNAQTPSILCGLPFADVNIRIGGRLYTKRADDGGNWSMTLPLSLGWNNVTLAQAVDSRVGGAWSESCESNEVQLGVRETGGPVISVPLDITVPATGPKGAQVFYPDVTAMSVSGAPVPVTCVPPSGSTFRVGLNPVLCTATDPDTGKVGLAEFAITVVDGPPQIQAFDVTLEADSPLGATLNAYTNVTVFDVVDPSPALSCVPATPHFFLLDQIMPVVCTATDDTNLSASAAFKVRVVDTTPPELCELPDIKAASDASGGAIVKFNTCAKDIVDGPVPVVCDPRSGSFFPVGKTKVTCAAVDKHGNKSAPSSFIVDVGDSTPPVLKLPGTVNATATSRNGARVNFTVTATDNVDPNPKVKCTPASGSLFPLGTSPVNCTATDAAGNTSSGGFKVKVTVAWGGLLHPVDGDGSSRFLLGLPIGLRFALTGASSGIYDLQAKLFVAPLNAAGQPGTERPAVGLPPGAGNLFYFLPIINQYAMLLDTRPLSVGPWQLRVDLGDGEIHTERITMFKLF